MNGSHIKTIKIMLYGKSNYRHILCLDYRIPRILLKAKRVFLF